MNNIPTTDMFPLSHTTCVLSYPHILQPLYLACKHNCVDISSPINDILIALLNVFITTVTTMLIDIAQGTLIRFITKNNDNSLLTFGVHS